MTELKKNLINIIGISVATVLSTWTVTVLYKKYKSKKGDSDKKGEAELSTKQDNEVKASLVKETPKPIVEVPEPTVEVKKMPEPVQEVFTQTPQKVLNSPFVADKAQELQDNISFKDEDDFTVVKRDDITEPDAAVSVQKDNKNTINIIQRDIIVKVVEDDEEEEESETSSRDSRSSSISEEEEVPQVTFKPFVRK